MSWAIFLVAVFAEEIITFQLFAAVVAFFHTSSPLTSVGGVFIWLSLFDQLQITVWL